MDYGSMRSLCYLTAPSSDLHCAALLRRRCRSRKGPAEVDAVGWRLSGRGQKTTMTNTVGAVGASRLNVDGDGCRDEERNDAVCVTVTVPW